MEALQAINKIADTGSVWWHMSDYHSLWDVHNILLHCQHNVLKNTSCIDNIWQLEILLLSMEEIQLTTWYCKYTHYLQAFYTS